MNILRHSLDITDYQTVICYGELLSVAQSRSFPNEQIDLWSLNCESYDQRFVAVYVVGTGNPMPDELRDDEITRHDPGIPPATWRKFLGTVVTPSGLVWHVFQGPLQ